ncbi:Uncharacterized protein TCM_009379 [Theobroma cacao]|uniref:Ubiquitin-like protease family profile domain-containing protein n=1 Tax=Theobroma cacao TaxID=3641 RepID=A0A061E5W0_THECC|nr:Uncharacterized protein TCM_009379 [Theobroma cacao]
MASTGTKQDNVEYLLYVPRHSGGSMRALTSTGTCFGHMMDVELDKSLFYASLVHNLMLRRINEPDAIEAKLWIARVIPNGNICFGAVVGSEDVEANGIRDIDRILALHGASPTAHHAATPAAPPPASSAAPPPASEAAQHSQPTPSLEAPPPSSEVEEGPHPASSRTTTLAHPALVPTPLEAPSHGEITPSLKAPPRPEPEDAFVSLASKYLRNSVLCKRACKHHPQHYKQRICIVDTSFYLILLGMSKEMQPSPTEKTFKLSEAIMPDDVLQYARGERLPWGLPCIEVDSILVLCYFNNHWVIVHINLLKLTMMLVDSSYNQTKALKFGLHDKHMSPRTSLFPIICHQAGYFVSSCRQKRALTQMSYRLNEKTPI